MNAEQTQFIKDHYNSMLITCVFIMELLYWQNSKDHRDSMAFPYPIICCGDHQCIWQQDGCFGLLDVCDRYHWNGYLGEGSNNKQDQNQKS